MKPISVQLYSLRDAAQEDFIGVLKGVAEIGYKGVEFAGLYGNDSKEIAKVLGDLGLVTSSSHTALPTRENIAELADTELTLGNKRVISGFGPDAFVDADGIKRVIDQFNVAAELVAPYGLSFGFHNHWWEMDSIGGKRIYDTIMEECPKVFGEMDTYWVKYGKADPAEMVAKYKSRLPLLHIKDGPLVEGPHTALGKGKMDIPPIIAAADPNVLDWLIVEIDACECDVFQAVRESYDYLIGKSLAIGNR